MDNIILSIFCHINYAAVIPGHHIASHHIHNLFCLWSHLLHILPPIPSTTVTMFMPFQIQKCHRQSPKIPISPAARAGVWLCRRGGVAWPGKKKTKFWWLKIGIFPFWRIFNHPNYEGEYTIICFLFQTKNSNQNFGVIDLKKIECIILHDPDL